VIGNCNFDCNFDRISILVLYIYCRDYMQDINFEYNIDEKTEGNEYVSMKRVQWTQNRDAYVVNYDASIPLCRRLLIYTSHMRVFQVYDSNEEHYGNDVVWTKSNRQCSTKLRSLSTSIQKTSARFLVAYFLECFYFASKKKKKDSILFISFLLRYLLLVKLNYKKFFIYNSLFII